MPKLVVTKDFLHKEHIQIKKDRQAVLVDKMREQQQTLGDVANQNQAEREAVKRAD